MSKEVLRAQMVEAMLRYMDAVSPETPAAAHVVHAPYADQMANAIGIFAKKHRSYGLGNIVVLGGEGVSKRIREKLVRIKQIEDLGLVEEATAYYEDGPPDLTNYGAIIGVVLDGKWPGAKWKGVEEP